MRYSYNKLRELSGTEKSPEELAKLLTFHAFEVESVEPYAHGLDGVVVGRVETVDQHPDADRLRVTTVVTGEESPRTIVCGAPNVAAGQMVAVALPGTTLVNGMEIKESDIRGVVSSGMICAEDELGLGDMHEGILVLPEDASVGTPFAEYLSIEDTILDIDILPNRGCDALSLRGVAREIAALEDRPFSGDTESSEAPEALESPVTISIETDRCLRYVGAVLDGISGDTPIETRSLLLRSGLQPRNLAVDVTNAMLLLYGQPMHAFDADRIQGGIVIRQAKEGEHLELLDESLVKLDPDDIVIADDEGPIALAGVMGGARTAVSDGTTRIVLEVASFNPISIRKSAKRHGIRSDSSYRFERFVDPERASAATADAIRSFQEQGAALSGMTDRFPNPTEKRNFPVLVSVFKDLLGIDVDLERSKRMLGYLGLEIAGSDDEWTVTVPSYRPDISDEWDISEEVGRMAGYDVIPSIAPTIALRTPVRNPVNRFTRELKSFLSGCGWDEIMTYSFYAEATAGRFASGSAARHIRVENPMNPDQAVFRASLIPSLIESARENGRYFDAFRCFEVASVATVGAAGDPEERGMLGLAVVAEKGGSAFPILRGALSRLERFVGRTFEYAAADGSDDGLATFFHPTRTARISDENGAMLGLAGEISPILGREYGLRRSVAVAEIPLELLGEYFEDVPAFTELPKFPYATRDLSLRVDRTVPVGELTQVIRRASSLLRDAVLFDIFEKGETKNVAFHLVFGHDDRTVASKEVEAAVGEIMRATEDRFGASLAE